MLSFLLIGSVYFLLHSHHTYESGKKEIKDLKIRMRLIRQQKQQVNEKRKIANDVNDFVKKADELGLGKKRWGVYDVNINSPVQFEELEKLLNQCANSLSYYFKPILFHTKIIHETEENIKKKKRNKNPNIQEEENRENDVELVLRGSFVIRTK